VSPRSVISPPGTIAWNLSSGPRVVVTSPDAREVVMCSEGMRNERRPWCRQLGVVFVTSCPQTSSCPALTRNVRTREFVWQVAAEETVRALQGLSCRRLAVGIAPVHCPLVPCTVNILLDCAGLMQ
jgi:hypothetical protein